MRLVQTTRWDRVVPLNDADGTAIQQLVVIGAGGHGRELADIVRAVIDEEGVGELLGVVDDGAPDRVLLARAGIRFLGTTDVIQDRDVRVLIGIGDPETRQRIDERTGERTARPMVHPTATVGSASTLLPGAVIAQEATLTTNVHLGRHSHLNVGSSVSHDCRIGSYVTICPGARITGNVTLGDRVFVGTGAIVLPGVTVGDDVVIGAGATVCKDVEAGRTVKGVPAR